MRNNNYAQHRTASANGRKSDFWASPRIPRLLRGNTPPQYRHENTHASTKKERQKGKRTGTRTYTSHPPPYRRTYAGQTETKFRKRTHRAKRNKGKRNSQPACHTEKTSIPKARRASVIRGSSDVVSPQRRREPSWPRSLWAPVATLC